MPIRVAKAVLKLWNAARMSSGERKLAKLKDLKGLTKTYGGVSQALRTAKRAVKKDVGLKQLGAAKERIINKAKNRL